MVASPNFTSGRAAKTRYTEQEAALELGVSVAELRTMVRDHILQSEGELPAAGMAALQPSDLVVLRILVTMARNSRPVSPLNPAK